MVTSVVLTHNNESTLSRCLESLSWCDEIVVVDDGSTDSTKDIAKKFHAIIFERSLQNDFAAQRNFGLSKAKGDWILFIDSDEVVTKKLAQEILETIRQTKASGFFVKRTDIFFGTQLQFGETANVRLLRLAKKNLGIWKRSVHEIWNVTGEIEYLNHPLFHYPHQTLREFIDDINRYSTLHAQEFYKEGKRVSTWEILCFPVGKFIQNYILRQGFRDGTPGAIMAIMMSFHSFLSKGKLFALQEAKIKH